MVLNGLKRIAKWSCREKRLFLEAVFWLFLAKLMVWILPFRTCLKLASSRVFPGVPDRLLLAQIRMALLRANRLAFWKNVCLVHSFAARWMLRRRKISSRLFIGVHANNPDLRHFAHAWVTSHDTEIVDKGSDCIILLNI